MTFLQILEDPWRARLTDRMALKFNGKPLPLEPSDEASPELTCGIVMPISTMDGCPAEHWSDVQTIIKEAVGAIPSPRFVARLVSDGRDVGVIQKRIVQSLYNDPIVVCDVSCKNPNVMFELGLRLAFDKPTVIVKDDQTPYTFDTGIIEHVPYPRDLRFHRIVDFKIRLAEKIAATYHASVTDKNHSPFLKNFGQFTIATIDQKEVSGSAAVLAMLSDMQQDLAVLKQRVPESTGRARASSKARATSEVMDAVIKFADENPGTQLSPELLDYVARNADVRALTPAEFHQVVAEIANMLTPPRDRGL